MTLTELRYVVALAQQKHFGRAAKLCHVSQPTLSIAIKNFEKKLGITIFERCLSEIHITEVGQKIVIQAQRILEEMVTLQNLSKANQSQLETPIKVGAIYTLAPYLFPALIPKLNKIAPSMPLIIEEGLTENLKIQLQQGKLDAIFIALPFAEKGIVTKKIFNEPFVVLFRKDNPLAKKERIFAADLAKEKILLLGEGHCLRKQVIAACSHCYTEGLQQTIEHASLETLCHMVASGLGVTILPSSVGKLQKYNSILKTVPFESDDVHRTIAFAWRDNFSRTKAIDAILQAVT